MYISTLVSLNCLNISLFITSHMWLCLRGKAFVEAFSWTDQMPYLCMAFSWNRYFFFIIDVLSIAGTFDNLMLNLRVSRRQKCARILLQLKIFKITAIRKHQKSDTSSKQLIKQLLLKQLYSTFRRTMPTMDEKNNDFLSAIWIAKKW